MCKIEKKGSNFTLGPPITHSIFTLRLSIFFASKGDSSEILSREILAPALKDVKVFGSYSKTNVYKLFVDLFPSATHLLCDLHMKDNVQSKLSYLNFNITTKDEVMCDVFCKRLGDYVKNV